MAKLEGIWLSIAVNSALVFAQVAFGAYHVIGKEALHYIDAIIFAFYREIIAGPCLVLIALVVEKAKPDIAKDWWRFLLLGTTGVYLNQLLFIEGLALTSATQAAIMQPCIPVFTTALTLILRLEKFSVLKVIGILFAAGGAVVMVGVENISVKSSQTRGMLCLVGNTLAMSVYYIFQKPVLKKYPPISVTGWAYIIGSVEMGITALIISHKHVSSYGINHHVVIPLAYSIIFATVLTYMMLTWANKHAPASVVAAYSSLQPLTAAFLSYIFLHQEPKTNEYIGASAIIVGLGVVTAARVMENRREKGSAAEEHQPINAPPLDATWSDDPKPEKRIKKPKVRKSEAKSKRRLSFPSSSSEAFYPAPESGEDESEDGSRDSLV